MRIRSILLIALCFICLILLCSFKETDDFFRYEINDKGEAVIIAYVGEMFSNDIKIPSEIEGHTVTTIAESAFYNSPHITKVTIPGSVTTIGNAAFGYCPELSSVTIEDCEKQLNIGIEAFESCQMLSDIDFGSRPVYIDDRAFKNCIRLFEVDIGENIIHFGYQAFSGCESLVFNINGNDAAEQYAKDNFIPTSFFETDRFYIIAGVSSAVIILASIFAVYKIQKSRKLKKQTAK